MSEKKENWKEEMKTLIGETLDQKLKEWKPPKTDIPPSSPPKTEKPKREHKHFNVGDEICPDCYPNVVKAIVEKEFKGADHECTECGLPVRGEESGKQEWECPSCGSLYAKPRD